MPESFSICTLCGVEHSHPLPKFCAICADERQYLNEDGVQTWTTLDELGADRAIEVREMEPGLHGITIQPSVGIGHRPILAQTLNGNLLWDPPGYIDNDSVEQIQQLGGVEWIAASHPHMFGVQLEWSKHFGNAPVLVNERDREWLARPGDAIEWWDGELELAPGLELLRTGGHFPGSAVVQWRGADGKGVLLSSDTIFPVAAKNWVTFLRSYPNRLPLSGGTVKRMADQVSQLDFDRLYGNFPGSTLQTEAKQSVLRSANRHIAWVSGEFDHLT